MDTIVIGFDADTTVLKTVADQLLALGQISKEQYQAFVKASDAQKAAYANMSKSVQQVGRDAKSTSDQFRQMNEVVAGSAVKEAVQNINALGNEFKETSEKSQSLKAELKDLKAELALIEKAGDDTSEKFVEMSVRAAELEDQIGDTNERIKQMASDTRTFDLVAEGIRGLAAGFSAVTSAQALFGIENEDVQKALLKVQAAMALATSAQELMAIATKKGGIATEAYGFALELVEGIEKRFAISSAAAWATSTAGLSILIAGVAYLYTQFTAVGDAAQDVAKVEEEARKRREEQVKLDSEANQQYLQDQQQLYDDFVEAQSAKIKKGGLAEKAAYDERIAFIRDYLIPAYETQAKRQQIFGDTAVILIRRANKEIEDLTAKSGQVLGDVMKKQIGEMREVDAAVEEGLFRTGNHIKEFAEKVRNAKQSTDDPLITEKTVSETEDRANRIAAAIQMAYDNVKKAWEDAAKKQEELQATITQGIQSVANNAAGLATSIFSAETQALQDEKDKQLALAGENTEKRIAIEKKFAIQQAKIRREQAIVEKTIALFTIAVSTAQAIQQAIANDAAVPAIIPGTILPNPTKAISVSNMIASIAFATASAILQTTAIAATPLPTVPGFEKGTKKAPPGFKWVGERGPELINDKGGYAIIPNDDAKRIAAKWDVPIMPNASFSMPMIDEATRMMLEKQYTVSQTSAIDEQRLAKAIASEIRTTNISIDKGGFKIHIAERNRNVEILNQRYDG